MPIFKITRLNHPGADMFSGLTDAALRRETDGKKGIFIAESPKVIRVALAAGYEPIAMMCEERHLYGDASDLLPAMDGLPVYTADRELLHNLTGYELTRGVLCAMRRPESRSVEDVCSGAGRVAVLDGVCDATNVGAIFRSAAALGIDAVLLAGAACDPLNRRVVRVSMGTVLLMPWARLDRPVSRLSELGLRTVALALTERSVTIDNPCLKAEPRLALVLGTEGDGLDQTVIDSCDYTARIPMSRGVDSLNVGAAAAVAFWELRYDAPKSRDEI